MGNSNESVHPVPVKEDRITSFKIVLYDQEGSEEIRDFAYSSARPIEGSLQIECTESVPAYGIEIALIQNDYSHTWKYYEWGGTRRTKHFIGSRNQTIVS